MLPYLSMRNNCTLPVIIFLSICLLANKSFSQIISGNCFIQGKYVELGIGPCGTFGTSIDAPPGYHPRGGSSGNPLKLGFIADQGKDGWNTGSPNYCGDYYVPGTPEEGWGLTVNGLDYNNNLLCGVNMIPGSVTQYRNDGSKITGVWQGNLNGLEITAKTYVPIDKLYFLTEITLKNISADTLSEVYYMRNIDPDNEVTMTGTYTTKNTIVNQNPNIDNKAVVTAEGLTYGCFIALGTRDCRAKVAFGGFSNRSAQAAYRGVSPHISSGTTTEDKAITIAFYLGTLEPGQQTSLKFVNVLNIADLDEAVDLTGPSFEIGQTEEIGSGDTAEICATGPTQFEVVNTGGFDKWTWAPATGLNRSTGPSVICDGSIDTITYVATGLNSCGGSISISFTAIKGLVTHVPKAGPVIGTTNFCLPNTTATFSVAPIPRAKKYNWTVPHGASILSGDGTSTITVSLGSTIMHDSISVYGINVCGPGDSSQIKVTVCDCNTIYPVTPATGLICPGDSIKISTKYFQNASYKWYRNAILLPNITNYEFYVKDSGSYSAEIFPNGFCMNYTTRTRIDFTKPPEVSLHNSEKIYKCEGSPISLVASIMPNAPGPVTIDWYKNGILVASNGPSIYTTTEDGAYSVKVTNAFQCKSVSDTDIVISHRRPVLTNYAFNGDPVTCEGRLSQLKGSYISLDGTINKYEWYNNGALIDKANDSFLIVSSSGNYSVKLTSSHGCTNLMRDTNLVFYPVPVADFTAPSGCVVNNFTFTDNSTIAGGSVTGWTWKQNGTVLNQTQHPNVNLPPGTYDIQLTVKSDKGCASLPATKSFLRYGKPTANFTVLGTCADSLTKLTAIPLSAGYGNTKIDTWKWEFGNGLQSTMQNPSLIYHSAGNYIVRLRASSDKCPVIEDTIEKKIFLGGPLAAMRYSNVIAVEGEPFYLYGGRDGISYNWYPPIGLSSTVGRSPSGNLAKSQLYYVHVINRYGCGRIDSVQVNILNDCKIWVPNAFSPNNDGKNDILRAFFGCLKKLDQFTIFNRWGQIVFTTTISTHGWDGRIRGLDQQPGTYIWIAEGEFKSGARFSEKGTFTLVR